MILKALKWYLAIGALVALFYYAMPVLFALAIITGIGSAL